MGRVGGERGWKINHNKNKSVGGQGVFKCGCLVPHGVMQERGDKVLR